MSLKQIFKIEALAKQPPKHGQWAKFCIEEGLSKDAVFHWRKKLNLPMRNSNVCR